MYPMSHREELSDILEIEANNPHQVITMRARNKIRVFCNYARCTYEDFINDPEDLEIAVTEHESLNQR